MPSIADLADACLLPPFVGLTAPDWVLRRLEGGMRGVTLFGRNIESRQQVAALTAQLRAARSDVLIAIDEEGGDVTRLEYHVGSSYPGNYALGVIDDLDLTRAVAASIGADLAMVGINFDLAPVADVNSNPLNPVIGVRSFGSDAALVGRHVAAYVEGLQSHGVIACAKHFPGHGDTTV
ncbi:MAG: beta-N-acetylhexosaminidase, partial [Frankiaceae bacterium]|nr:beta-N-acetylhexosaminidase [Frankiaceae bacterium]